MDFLPVFLSCLSVIILFVFFVFLIFLWVTRTRSDSLQPLSRKHKRLMTQFAQRNQAEVLAVQNSNSIVIRIVQTIYKFLIKSLKSFIDSLGFHKNLQAKNNTKKQEYSDQESINVVRKLKLWMAICGVFNASFTASGVITSINNNDNHSWCYYSYKITILSYIFGKFFYYLFLFIRSKTVSLPTQNIIRNKIIESLLLIFTLLIPVLAIVSAVFVNGEVLQPFDDDSEKEYLCALHIDANLAVAILVIDTTLSFLYLIQFLFQLNRIAAVIIPAASTTPSVPNYNPSKFVINNNVDNSIDPSARYLKSRPGTRQNSQLRTSEMHSYFNNNSLMENSKLNNNAILHINPTKLLVNSTNTHINNIMFRKPNNNNRDDKSFQRVASTVKGSPSKTRTNKINKPNESVTGKFGRQSSAENRRFSLPTTVLDQEQYKLSIPMEIQIHSDTNTNAKEVITIQEIRSSASIYTAEGLELDPHVVPQALSEHSANSDRNSNDVNISTHHVHTPNNDIIINRRHRRSSTDKDAKKRIPFTSSSPMNHEHTTRQTTDGTSGHISPYTIEHNDNNDNSVFEGNLSRQVSNPTVNQISSKTPAESQTATTNNNNPHSRGIHLTPLLIPIINTSPNAILPLTEDSSANSNANNNINDITINNHNPRILHLDDSSYLSPTSQTPPTGENNLRTVKFDTVPGDSLETTFQTYSPSLKANKNVNLIGEAKTNSLNGNPQHSHGIIQQSSTPTNHTPDEAKRTVAIENAIIMYKNSISPIPSKQPSNNSILRDNFTTANSIGLGYNNPKNGNQAQVSSSMPNSRDISPRVSLTGKQRNNKVANINSVAIGTNKAVGNSSDLYAGLQQKHLILFIISFFSTGTIFALLIASAFINNNSNDENYANSSTYYYNSYIVNVNSICGVLLSWDSLLVLISLSVITKKERKRLANNPLLNNNLMITSNPNVVSGPGSITGAVGLNQVNHRSSDNVLQNNKSSNNLVSSVGDSSNNERDLFSSFPSPTTPVYPPNNLLTPKGGGISSVRNSHNNQKNKEKKEFLFPSPVNGPVNSDSFPNKRSIPSLELNAVNPVKSSGRRKSQNNTSSIATNSHATTTTTIGNIPGHIQTNSQAEIHLIQ